MSLAADLARHVPYLRRYARALTGSQADGDAYVRGTLEAIVAAPERLRKGFDTRVALYRVFQDVWASHPSQQMRNNPHGEFIAERLDHLGLAPRQALLLTAMEGFNPAQAADILNRTPDEIAELIERGVADLMALPPSTALIIEDEPLISLELSSIVAEMGHTVCGVAATRDQAVARARATNPGFILADIQLADGSSGIDAVREIFAALFEIPVIFITAYPERLLTGERAEPTLVVTKPFEPERLKSTIGHALLLAAEARTRAA